MIVSDLWCIYVARLDFLVRILQTFCCVGVAVPYINHGIGTTAYVASFGEAALAGYGIGSRVEFLIIPLVFGLGSAMTSVVGVSVGAKDL